MSTGNAQSVTDGHLPPHLYLAVRLLNEFQKWSDEGVNATLLPGNHDQVGRSSSS